MKRTLAIALVSLLAFSSTRSLLAIASKSSVGENLPALKLEYVGAKPDLAGKPLIVEFWATWCPPCRESIPHLNALYKKYQGRGLAIIGVSDEDSATIKKFTKTVPMDYAAATDGGKLGEQLGILGIPHALLVDRSGKIVWEGDPTELPANRIEQVLK